MPEYAIRLHKADGDLSVVMKVDAVDGDDAKRQARHMLKTGIEYATVFDGDSQIAFIRRRG